MGSSNLVTINESGNLTISGCDLQELAITYGTPLNILDENAIRENCREFTNTLKTTYPDYQVMYAGKALLTRSICKLIHQEGLGLDVVSGGELYIAQSSGFPPENIIFHGNNKSESELIMALTYGVKAIVVDNLSELYLLGRLAKQFDKEVQLFLRITPGVDANTHNYIKTGIKDSKFGFNLQGNELWEVISIITSSSHLKLTGLHSHIGSQIIDSNPFELAAKSLMNLAVKINRNYGITISELDLGGGFGIQYKGTEQMISKQQLLKNISDTVQNLANKNNLALPKLIIEPGRSIIGEAGTMLYTIGSIKNIPGIRKYISVDGGMSDNIRPALYNAQYTGIIANKANEPKAEVVTVAGKACESGDILIKDLHTPTVNTGDLLAMPSCGAYTYSMASNYNQLPRPAVILVNNGQSDLIMERETYDKLLMNDVVPDRLSGSSSENGRRSHDLH